MKLKPTELTTLELQEAFGVGAMTIYNWRKGSERISCLPFNEYPISESGKCRITFSSGKVKQWAKKNDVSFSVALSTVLSKRKNLTNIKPKKDFKN